MAIRTLLFDAANTLIYKPSVFTNITEVLKLRGFSIEEKRLKYNHKLVSELIEFPDITSRDFYEHFNESLLLSFGIEPSSELLEEIFDACTYQPWKSFEDVDALKELHISKNIVSNFNKGLAPIIEESCGEGIFDEIIISEEEKCRKPDLAFYRIAIERLKVDPQEILYIGDSFKLDILPAKKLGLNAVLIDRDDVYPDSKDRIRSFNEIKNLI